jgi:hypothetical protein
MTETYYLNGKAYTFETQEELDTWLANNPGASTVDNSVAAQDATFVNPAIIPDQIGNPVSDEPLNIEMSEQEQLEFETKRDEQYQKGREGSEKYLREKKIKDKTGLLPSQYPQLQTSNFGPVPITSTVDLDAMEEITANVTAEYRDELSLLMSDEFETLKNMAEDPMTYDSELNTIHDRVFSTLQEKYPGLSKRSFMDISGKGGMGIFETALRDITAKSLELDAAENLVGAVTLDDDILTGINKKIELNFSKKELDKRDLTASIRNKNRELSRILNDENPDYKRASELKSEIRAAKNDIQKLATIEGTGNMGEYSDMFGPSKDTKDKKLASSYMDNETTKYRQRKIDEAKNNFNGNVGTQVANEHAKNPKLSDFQAHDLLYKSKAFNLQQLWVSGNKETINVKLNSAGSSPELYQKLVEGGYVTKEQRKNPASKLNINVPIKALFDMGYDGRDFEGVDNFFRFTDVSDEDKNKLLNYESAVYRNLGELESLYELTYINNDPETFDRGGGFGEFARSTISAVATHFTDIAPQEADKLASMGPGSTDAIMLQEFEKLGNTYNETYKDAIAEGTVDELGFTAEQIKAIDKTFTEEVGEGFGHFVPMLMELGVISAATGFTMTATGFARTLATMRNAGGWKKAQYHAIMTMVEEGKMFTAGFDPGAGASFYAGGQLTSGVSPFKKRFKWLDPLFQKVIKGGPVGVGSVQIATNLEAGIQDLLGNKDFQATIDTYYGDLTFKDLVVEGLVFSIAGATHVKRTDFMSTRRKYEAITEIDNKMNDLMKSESGEKGQEGFERGMATVFRLDSEGNLVRIRPEGYEMMSTKDQAKWEALNEAKRSLEAMTKYETTAIELDPNNKDFESNVDKMYTQPINETLKSVNKEFEGFKVEFTENAKDTRFPEGADGAAFLPGKGKDPGVALFLKSKFTPEKLTHEVLGHVGLESYFNRNPQAEVKFQKNISKLFEKFDFQAYDGTPLGEFISKNYSKEIGAGNNIKPREFFAYMFELLTDPKIYYQKVAPSFFKEAKQEMLSVIEESTGIKPKIRNVKEFVEFIGRLSMDARRGLNIQTKVARLADLEDLDFLGIDFVVNKEKNTEKALNEGYSSKNLNRQKEVFLENKKESEILDVEGKKQETPLYTLDKHLFDSSGNKKYETKEEFQRSQDFVSVYEKLLGDYGVLDPRIKEGMTDVIPTAEGMTTFVNRVKNQLQTRLIKNYDPAAGGGSLYGYMHEIAIPKEKSRVKENYLKDKETGKEGTTSLDLMSEKGTVIEPEAPKSDLLERLETEIIIPSRTEKEKKQGPEQYVDMIKNSFKTEKEKEKYNKDIDKAVVEADINIDLEKPTYKDVKSEVGSVVKITKKDAQGNLIIDKKTGAPKLFTPTKEADAVSAGRLPKVLEIVSEKYGIPLKRMLANQTLNTKMRQTARTRISQTVNSWKKALPEGETISGTATGVGNTSWKFLYNFEGGRGSFAEGKTAAGKEVVSKRKNITTQEILDAVGIDASGNFLPGTKYDSAIKEYIKLESQWTAVQSMRKTGEGRFTEAALAETGSGRSEALASKMIKEFSETFKLDASKTQDIFINYAIGNKYLVDKKYQAFLDRFSKHEFFQGFGGSIWTSIEQKGLKGKAVQTKFMAEFNNYWENYKGSLPEGVTAKDIKALQPKAFYSESKGNVFVDSKRLDKHVDISIEYAKMLPKGFEKNLTFFDQVIGLHQRVTMEKEGRDAKFGETIDAITGKKVPEIQGDFKGFIMERDGTPVIDQPYTKGRERALPNIGKNVSEVWKGIEIKFKSASTQEAAQKKMAKAGNNITEQLKIASENFSILDNRTKEDIYFAIQSTKQEFIEAGKNKQEKLDRIEWMYNVERSNTNLRLGLRQMVPVKYVYFANKSIVGEAIKLEHLKAMVTQSIQSANLVASGTFKTNGKKQMADFMGITSVKKILDIVDKFGGTTNTSGLFRMALLHPKILSQFKSVESGFKRTLLEDVMMKYKKEVGAKKFNEQIKNHKSIEKLLDKQLKRGGFSSKDMTRGEKEKAIKIHDNAIKLGRDKKKKARGMSTFDFDETVGVSENYVFATKGKQKKKIASAEWPFVGDKLLKEGWKMDFTDFNRVTNGKPGPLMQKMKNQIKKYGSKNVFILTARAKESQKAIHDWLKSEGVEIPIENITGLGNSTGEAKAMWMLEKFSEGYNDMYFVDDAMPNVKAVRNVLEQLDIKSKVQQALASKDLGKEINNVMQHSLNIESNKVFSKAEAKVRGKDIKRRRVFMRDSAADLELLIEPLYGKGKKGNENKKWFKKEFIMPFETGIRDYNTARQSAKNDYMALRKQNKDVVKQISKEVEGTSFTNDMAMRVYLWNKAGYKIPDLAKTTETKLVEHVMNNPKLKNYAETFATITKQEKGLKEPGENWWAETMAGEVTNIDRGVSRKQYLQEFIDVKNEIFNEANLNKMESKLGTRWRENITDMFDRMETGRTRSLKLDRGSTAMMNYLNGGIGTIMNFNTRSAALQTISTLNFLNMRENNPISAGRAMANVPQFAKDFMFIMNSDMLKQRRDGLAINVTEAEIASAAASSENMIQSVISKVLKVGYTPTKLADSFAISFGGATFYRNRIKMYEKQGMKTKDAEKQSFLDFQVLAERTQQSSRADLLSRQQTSLIGRIILPFANTPMQMNRAGMKDILDVAKGRTRGVRNVSEAMGRITYYMGAQVAIFAGLQSALFGMLFNDEDVSEDKIASTKAYTLQSTMDSMLRGFGVQGALISTFKNATLEFLKQNAKPAFKADYSEIAEDLLNLSPPIGSKFGMLDAAGDRLKYNRDTPFKFELGNGKLEAALMTIQATSNAPVYAPYQNINNMKHALSDQYETWQRVLMGAGWTPYNVGIELENKKKSKKKKTRFTKDITEIKSL